MSVVQDLLRARTAYDRRDWVAAYSGLSEVEPDAMGSSDLLALGTVAYLLGEHNDCVQALQRAFQAHLAERDPHGAIRCACWLARTLMMHGETAVASGWAGRASRLLEETGQPEDMVEHGYVAILEMYRNIFSGQMEAAMELAEEIGACGRRFHDPDLTAMGFVSQGRMLLYAGRVPEGLARLDEAMATIASGEVSVVFAGDVYCTMIEGCQEISDFSRASEWTAALTSWCESQPGLVAFTGQCAVHRGQIMRLHGAYDDALEEFDEALARYRRMGIEPATGLSHYERGDVLRVRGRLAEAEAAYDEAIAHGHEAQPGLALLWSAQGKRDAAAAAIRRMLAEPRDPVHRSQLLPAAVEVLLDAEAPDEAGQVADELTEIASSFACDGLEAAAEHSRAAVALADTRPTDAVTHGQAALRNWNDLRAPYESALARVLVGRGLSDLGDETSARSELQVALKTFAELGTEPAEARVRCLLADERPGGLSPREVEVLGLVARGRSNREIAEHLSISEKTVARHLSNTFTKLDVASRTAAAAFAFEHDLA
jgi:DNA-binding CsgD family transcriptional regulator